MSAGVRSAVTVTRTPNGSVIAYYSLTLAQPVCGSDPGVRPADVRQLELLAPPGIELKTKMGRNQVIDGTITDDGKHKGKPLVLHATSMKDE